MVTGGPATMVAAELGGGARWPQLREGKREREEARPGQELTPERMPWTVMAGEAGVEGAVVLDARWPAREGRGRRRRTSASRANSFGVEAQYGKAVKMASSA